MPIPALAMLTAFALIAFAGNSVLCRLALQDQLIDANSFTIIRLISGAACLITLLIIQKSPIKLLQRPNLNQFKQAGYLFTYAACFSISYLMLGTAVGALVLFVTVQLTMLSVQYLQGRKANPLELIGLGLALGSFIAWMAPAAQRPDSTGVFIMIFAGIAWGLYTLAGKSSTQPQIDTAQNFFYSLIFIIFLLPLYWFQFPLLITEKGILLASTSGAITSGLGYWLWYRVLPSFSALSAGVMQLSVPMLAAIGGIIWNHEPMNLTFILACTGILSGIFLVLYSSQHKPAK